MPRKKILTGFILFLGFMWLCTVISKSIYASKLPMVTVSSPEQKYIEHIVEAEGMIEAGSKIPVTALSGLLVEKLMVSEGDKIAEGDMLFTIDMNDLREIISGKQAEIAELQLQINTILENKSIAEQKKALEEKRAREDFDALSRYQDTLVGRAAEEVVRAEEESEESAFSEDRQMEDQLKSAAYGEADAKWNRDNALKEVERKIEDIMTPENKDTDLESCNLKLNSLNKELSFYQEIINYEGRITAETSGMVTDIFVDSGSRIPDTAVMLLSDDTVPYKLKVNLNGAQKKYVGLNDEVSLRLQGSSREIDAKVNYASQSENMPGYYEIVVDLPNSVGIPGLSCTLIHRERGEKYPFCISPLALHKEESKSYVYVMKEREGILGMECYVEEVVVKVLDENDSFVAVEGAIDENTKVIISATKEIHKGDTVRYY